MRQHAFDILGGVEWVFAEVEYTTCMLLLFDLFFEHFGKVDIARVAWASSKNMRFNRFAYEREVTDDVE